MRLTLILVALLLTACHLRETELMCASDHRIYERRNGIWVDTDVRCMPERAIQ